jgi:ribosomal protein L14
MVKKETFLHPVDKCGVKVVKCFHILQGFNHSTAFVGHFLRISVRKRVNTCKFKKGKKMKSILIRTQFYNVKNDGSIFTVNENGCVLLKKRLTPRGKEIKGPISTLIRRRKFTNSFAGKI